MENELEEIIMGKNGSREGLRKLAIELSSTDSSDSARAAFLSSIHVRGETPEEIEGFSYGILSLSTLGQFRDCSDIVGTGGDRKGTINVSTAASLVCSSLGIRIGKHGNRSITGKFGSADFMEACGYKFDMEKEEVIKRLKEDNFVFILAPMYNASFRSFSEVRKKLGHPTIFNIMGPITNPLNPSRAVVGSTTTEIQNTLARVMALRGMKGYSIRSEDGMDEISTNGLSSFLEVRGEIKEHMVDGSRIIGRRVDDANIMAQSREKILSLTLSGLKGENPDAASFIALNAAPCILLNRITDSLESAYKLAMSAIQNGKAFSTLANITGGKAREVLSIVS